jgi:hypothetical protein
VANVAPAGSGGASHPCSVTCGFASKVPLEPPAYALLHGKNVRMEIECSAACSGSGTLHYPPRNTAAAASAGKLVTTFHFRLKSHGATAVTAKLTAAGQKLVRGNKPVVVSITVIFKERGRTITYVSAVDITRKAPKAAAPKKKSVRAGTLIQSVIVLPD